MAETATGTADTPKAMDLAAPIDQLPLEQVAETAPLAPVVLEPIAPVGASIVSAAGPLADVVRGAAERTAAQGVRGSVVGGDDQTDVAQRDGDLAQRDGDVVQADVPSVQRDASLATGQPESHWAAIAAPLRAKATEAVSAKWTMAVAAGVNETGVGNMTDFTERGLVGEMAALDQGIAGDAGVSREPAAFGETTVLVEPGVAADAAVFGEARSTGLAAGQRGHEQSFLAGYLPTASGHFGGTGGGAHGAENAATALGFEPVAPWGVGLGPRQVELEVAQPWPTSLPGAPAPGPGDGGAVELPMAGASSGGLGISSSGQGGSVVPNLAPLDLVASWRALWLLAMVHPSDICLPGLAPSG